MSKLESGMIFKNTLELCNFMGFKYNKSHPEKNRFQLSCYCNWHKLTRTKVIIDDVFEIPIDFKQNHISEYRYNVGDIVEVHSGKLKILKKVKIKKNNGKYDYYQKAYICKCMNDGFEFSLLESKILNNRGRSVCANRKVIKGINDVATTHPDLVKYFSDINDAYKYTYGSNENILFKCPDCEKQKKMYIYTLSEYGLACNKCSDGISYPEKFMICLLDQLKIEYITQLNKRDKKWCDKYFYDFLLLNTSCIIEVNGIQHYEQNKIKGSRLLKEEQENDKYKERLAKSNNIEHYISIDAIYSQLEWIKNSIMNSELPRLLNFKENKINWSLCDGFALSNLVKVVCDYKQKNKYKTTSDISKIFNLGRTTVTRYLKRGTKLGWCDYNPRYEQKNKNKAIKTKYQKNAKPIKCIENNLIFGNISICENNSLKLFDTNLNRTGILRTINKTQKSTKGYTFQYITREEFNTIKQTSPELAFGDFFILSDSTSQQSA